MSMSSFDSTEVLRGPPRPSLLGTGVFPTFFAAADNFFEKFEL